MINFYTYNQESKVLILNIFAKPFSKNNSFDGVFSINQKSFIKIKVNADPINGKANSEIISFLSGILGVPKSNISVVGGAKSKYKVVKICLENEVLEEILKYIY